MPDYVTKQDLADAVAELKASLERAETTFYKWGRTSDVRTRQALTDIGMLNERMLNIEDRVSAIERSKSGL